MRNLSAFFRPSLLLLFLSASLMLRAQFSEDFESTNGRRDSLTNRCWSFAAVAVKNAGSYNSNYGLFSGPTTNHSESSPHFAQLPLVEFAGATTLEFDYAVNQNKTCGINVTLIDINGSETLLGTVYPTKSWQHATINFTHNGVANLRLEFYSNPFGSPNGSHRMKVDNIELDLGAPLTCSDGGYPALPVEWVQVDARPAATGVAVSWETTNEENHDYFVVERSANGYAFEAIAQVREGETIGRSYFYGFTDRGVRAGETYVYRIRQVDFDGGFSYSPRVEVALTGMDDGTYDFFTLMGQPLFRGTPEEFFRRFPGQQVYVMKGTYGARKVVHMK